MYQEAQGGMETRSIDRDFAWLFISFQYQQNHEKWDEDLDNNEVEHVLPQYAKIILQTKDLEEHAFTTESTYQTKRKHRVEHNIPPIMTTGTEVQKVDQVNVL